LTHANFVLLRDTFGDTNDERDFGFDSFNDGIGSERRRDVDDGSFRFRLVGSLFIALESSQSVPKRAREIGEREGFTSRTEPKTGSPKCSVPAFLGETPPTSLVPNSRASLQWKVAC